MISFKMNGFMNEKINFSMKWLMIIVVLFFMMLNAYAVWPRLLYQNGLRHLQKQDYQGAVTNFTRAIKWMPPSINRLVAGPDLFRMHLGAGEAFYKEGFLLWRKSGLTSGVLGSLQRGKQHLTSARHKEPMDYVTAYWLARTEAALEKAYGILYPEKENLYQASTYFKEAMNLRPSGGEIRYLYARYLYGKGQMDAIPRIVQKILELSPYFYEHLRKETFFNSAMYASAEEGLRRGLQNRFVIKDAQRSLSELYLNMGEFDSALEVFQKALPLNSLSIEDLAKMGILHVASGHKEKGFDFFDRVLASTEVKDSTIDSIYDYFDRSGQFELFLEYSFHARKNGLRSMALEINVAKGMIKEGLFPFARARLVQINTRHGDARVYDLLAQVSEAEGDWEGVVEMTLAGIALAPKKANFYYRLSRAYERLGKFGIAKKAAIEAILLEPENRKYRFQGRRLEKYRN